MHATGPRTGEGKAASSRNAVKHGLLSETPLVTCLETAEDWQTHLQGVLEDLAPQGQMETCLAERAGLLLWRMRRLAHAEVEWIDLAQAGVEKEWRERAGSSPYSEAGDSYQDRLDSVKDCQELYEFAVGLPSAPAESSVPGELAAAYLYTLPELISLPVLEARAAAGLDRLKHPEELEWTVASLREHLAAVAERLGMRCEELDGAMVRSLLRKAVYSAAEAQRATALMKNVRASRLLPRDTQLETLTRYEAHLGRELARTMKALRDLQSRRSAGAKPDEPLNSNGDGNAGLPVATVPAAANTPAYSNGSAPHPLLAAPTTKNCETNPLTGAMTPDLAALPALARPKSLLQDCVRNAAPRSPHWTFVS